MKELLIPSSVLILALVALRFLFRNQISRRLQYALWLLVVLRLLIPISLLPRASFSVLSGTQALTERWEQTTTLPELHLPELPNAASTETSVELTPTESVATVDADAPAQPAATQDAQGSSFSLSWRMFARVLWGMGAVTVLAWLLAVNLRFRKQLMGSRRAVEVPGCPLPVYVTDTVVSPCLFGLFRPAVYLTPKALESEESLRHVLTHELCHYRHGDHIWALVRSVLLAVYWFDPLVWLAASLSRTDGELACDEAAIRRLGSEQRLTYGKTLVDMVAVQRSPAGIFCAATTMTSGKRSLKERLNRIVRRPKVVIPSVIAVVLLAAVCVACTFTGASKTTDADSASSESSGETATSQVTYTLSKVENGVETPIEDPDGFLAGEIFFDAMVKSSAAPAV